MTWIVIEGRFDSLNVSDSLAYRGRPHSKIWLSLLFFLKVSFSSRSILTYTTRDVGVK